jgi:hypothetical protein
MSENMNLLMRVKLLDAKQAALEAKMVAAEMRKVARSSTEAGIAGDRSARGLGKNFGRGPALAESTLAEKAAGGFPKTKLVRTGALKESLTTVEGGSHGIREVTGSELLFGHYCLVRHFCADWH